MAISENTDSEAADETTDVPEGPVVRWLHSKGWSKKDLDILVAFLTLFALTALALERLDKID